MKQIRVTNELKKNVIETETWYNEEKNVYVNFETGWRFATYTLNIEDDVAFEEVYGTNENGFCVQEFEIEDMESSDSFSFDVDDAWSPGKGLTEEQQTSIIDEVLELWEEDGWSGLESAGWDHHDTETWIYGPLEVEEVNQ